MEPGGMAELGNVIPMIVNNFPAALQTLILVGLLFWVVRADRVIMTMGFQIKEMQKSLDAHDIWERDFHERRLMEVTEARRERAREHAFFEMIITRELKTSPGE